MDRELFRQSPQQRWGVLWPFVAAWIFLTSLGLAGLSRVYGKGAVRVAVPVLTVAALIWWVDWSQVGGAVGRADPCGVVIFYTVVCGFMFLHFARIAYVLNVPLLAGADAIVSVSWMRMFAPDAVLAVVRWEILSRYTGSRSWP